METVIVSIGWFCLLAGAVLAIPLMMLGAKIGYNAGLYLGNAFARFIQGFMG